MHQTLFASFKLPLASASRLSTLLPSQSLYHNLFSLQQAFSSSVLSSTGSFLFTIALPPSARLSPAFLAFYQRNDHK